MKLIFGIWYQTKKWHIVENKIKYSQIDYLKNDWYAICNKDYWIDNTSNNNSYLYPSGNCINHAITYFNLDHICKNCIKMVDIEDVKTYIIYHKLGIKI